MLTRVFLVSESSVNAPVEFAQAVDSLKGITLRSEISASEIPSPAAVAPHSFALAADVLNDDAHEDSIHGTGRFILLYDPEQSGVWGGPFRVVCFAQAPLEREIGLDPMLSDVAWSWLVDALEVNGADYSNASGTATRILSKGFGELSAEGDGSQIELRASWSPTPGSMTAQVVAWAELLCMLAGLPPSSEAISMEAKRRERG